MAVPCKGTGHAWPAKQLAREIGMAGHRRYVYMSEGEPAILDLKRAVAKQLLEWTGSECVPEMASKGDSAGNGLAELAVKEIKAKVRTLAHAVRLLHGVAVDERHVAIPWLIQYAAALMNRSRRGEDGRTAWELRKGRRFINRCVPSVSESCGSRRARGLRAWTAATSTGSSLALSKARRRSTWARATE